MMPTRSQMARICCKPTGLKHQWVYRATCAGCGLEITTDNAGFNVSPMNISWKSDEPWNHTCRGSAEGLRAAIDEIAVEEVLDA